MAPRLLLVPQFTELEWGIRPQLEEWAEVATFDLPGVGDEPISAAEVESVTTGASTFADLGVRRAQEEVDRLGWDRYFVVGDAWGTATAARLATARPGPVLGLALGHASLDYRTEGERPAVNGELVAAMTQLLRSDYDSFVRYGLTQFTQGGWDEETAGRIVDRFPPMEVASTVWETNVGRPEPIGELLGQLDKPLLLAKHDGCLVFTAEGYEDAVAALPTAHMASVPNAPSASDDFAAALRDFCERVLS
jgi:pimeloyl-ACP methyl ester carboxylesterase